MGDVKNENDVIGVALIGIGRIGKVHVSNILRLPRVQLLYIIDVNRTFAEEYINEYNLVSTTALHTDDVDTAYEDNRVDAVIVCCPTQMHETHVKAALKKGKAVMCEKPLALSLESIVNCYKTAEDEKRPLFCAFNKRFDPQTAAIRSQIPEVVGRLKVVKSVSRDHPRNSIEYLKISGGIALDMAIHDVDMLIWLADQIPDTIHAIGHAHFDDIRDIGDVDQLFITMKFPDGTLGHSDINREATYGHDQRIEVFGSKGMLSGGNIRPLCHETHGNHGTTLPPIFDSCMSRYNESYRQEVMHFMDVVRGKSKLKVVGRETIWTTLCCHVVNESLSTGNPVKVHEFVQKKFPHILSEIDTWGAKTNGAVKSNGAHHINGV
uniref:inositol 2-dehydrogenase-like n=1 Tax=Styela clava TaxID=7725 RepID=UPI00193A8C4C|nr:inositol 2-dehydrogenase-like [Styela clava]